MFELPPNFDKNILEIKESKMRDSILKNFQINKETQVQTINFLIKAKNIILNKELKHIVDESEKKDENLLYDSRYATYYELKPSELSEEAPKQYPIQTRFEKPHVPSYPSEFYPGVINPIHKRLVKKNLVIDTRFRDNYYTSSSTNFTFTLPTNFNDVLQLEMISLNLPLSYYPISKQYGNNFLTITITETGGTPQTATISIQDGQYDQFSVIAAINSSLITLGNPFNLIIFNSDLNNNATNGNLIGTNKTLVGPITSGTVESYELNFQTDIYGVIDQSTPLPLKLGWMLGFRNGLYVNNLNYVSEGVIDVTGPKYIYLILDDHNNNVVKNFYSALNTSVLNNNILAQLPVANVSPYTRYISNLTNASSPPREYFGPVNLNSFTIQLLDEYGRIINLNNMDYSITLILTTIYDL